MRCGTTIRALVAADSLAFCLGRECNGSSEAVLSKRRSAGSRDLVFTHVPFNFGNTVGRVAMFGSGVDTDVVLEYAFPKKHNRSVTQMWEMARKLKQPDGELWGHFDPDLQVVIPETGCPAFLTPSKYWPKGLAESYFGNKTIVGVLRDPYERLIAMFRGNLQGYGAGRENIKWRQWCDVNAAVAAAARRALDLTSKDRFAYQCTLLPQAEYFDSPFGITLAVDNRKFPESMNELLETHGYGSSMRIAEGDILHVTGCNDVWAANLTVETKRLVQQAYVRDFVLLCKNFGYCDVFEDTCLPGVPEMCPEAVKASMAARYGVRPANTTGGFAASDSDRRLIAALL